MLYARCGQCTAVVPLWCTGQFMPHMPAPPFATPQGAYCSVCGVLPPIFVCGYCWCRQFVVLQGTRPPATQATHGQPLAAVIEAPAGASEHVLKKPFAAFLESLANEAGTVLAQRLTGSF